MSGQAAGSSLSGQAPAILAGAVCALMLAMGIGRFVYTPILPDMIAAGRLGLAQGGVIASANFAGYLAGSLLAIAIVARRRRLFWLRAGLIASVASTAAMALGDSLTLWFALRLLGGMASAFVLIFMSGLAIEGLIVGGRPQWAGWFYSGVGLGIVVSSLLIEGLQRLGADWRELWLASGALAAALGLVAWRGAASVPPSGEGLEQAAGGPVAGLWSRHFALLVVSYGGMGFGYVIHATYLPTLLRAQPALAGFGTLAWLIVGLAAVPSIPFWEWISRSAGRPLALIAAFLVQGAGLLVPVLWPSVAGAIVGAVALGGTFVAITSLGVLEARMLMPAQASRAIAIMTVAFSIGQISGPLAAAALLGGRADFLAPTLLASAVLALSGLILLPLVRQKAAA